MSVLTAGYVKEFSTGDILKLQSWQITGLANNMMVHNANACMHRHLFTDP